MGSVENLVCNNKIKILDSYGNCLIFCIVFKAGFLLHHTSISHCCFNFHDSYVEVKFVQAAEVGVSGNWVVCYSGDLFLSGGLLGDRVCTSSSRIWGEICGKFPPCGYSEN